MTSINARFPVKQVVIDENTAASNVLVALVADREIRVISLILTSAAPVVVTFEQVGGVDLTGPMTLDGAAAAPLTAYSETGLFWTAKGVGLNILLGGAVQVSGVLTYIEVV